MKLKVKPLNVSAQGHMVCMLNSEEAEQLQIRKSDRVLITKGKRKITAVVDITNTHHFLRKGSLGLMKELSEELGIKRNDVVDVDLSEEPYSVEYIKRKLNGSPLSDVEMHSIVNDIAKGLLSPEEISVFITACSVRGLSLKEIRFMVNSILGDSEPIVFKHYPLVDIRIIGYGSGILKHAVSSVVSSAGIPTIISLESSGQYHSSSSEVFRSLSAEPGERTNVNTAIDSINSAYISQEDDNITSALRKIKYSEAPMSLYPVEIMLSSLIAMVKELKSSHLYTCVVYGEDCPFETQSQAKSFVRKLDKISRKVKIREDSMLCDISELFTGNAGPYSGALVLMKMFSDDPRYSALKSKVLEISGNIIDMVKGSRGMKTAREVVDSGKALDQLVRTLKYYGSPVSRRKISFKGTFTHKIIAKKETSIISFNPKNVSRIARICGAPDDLFAGIEMHMRVHSVAQKKEPICTIHSKSKERLDRAVEALDKFPLFELS